MRLNNIVLHSLRLNNIALQPRRLSKKIGLHVAYKDLGDPQLLSSRPAFRRWQYVLQTIVGTGERGFNTVISDSAYELSYICALAAGSTDFHSSKEWLCIE